VGAREVKVGLARNPSRVDPLWPIARRCQL